MATNPTFPNIEKHGFNPDTLRELGIVLASAERVLGQVFDLQRAIRPLVDSCLRYEQNRNQHDRRALRKSFDRLGVRVDPDTSDLTPENRQAEADMARDIDNLSANPGW